MPPVRAELNRRLRGRDDLDRALSALVGNYRSHGGQLAVWDSFHESPANTRQLLRDDLLGQHPGSPAHQQTRDRAGTNQ